MAVSPGFRTFILEQLEQAAPGIRDKRMFGGVGLYADEDFFGIIDNDTLYFKVDDRTRPKFIAEGMEPFRPYGPDGETMGYYQVPASLLEDVDALRAWVEDAVAVARRAKTTKRRRSSAAELKPRP